MTSLFNKRNIIIGILVLGVVAVFSYRYAFVTRDTDRDSTALPREVSTAVSYETPKGTDRVRFILGLDSDGLVISVATTDVLTGDKTNEKLQTFSNNLLLIIQGKKLAELESIDRVGTSSLTTSAFNKALPALKAQI